MCSHLPPRIHMCSHAPATPPHTSMDMYTFDANIPGGFSEHVERQHNPLQYVFFLHHLNKTNPEEYTGGCV